MEKEKGTQITPPAVSLPKGGGAIRGIDEKFTVNPSTGTASVKIPIPVSPGRGFEPELSLSYDSGYGNGPFGFGWRLSLPSITRKTSKGLPTYRDGEEADTFVLSDAEDLVPVLVNDGIAWKPKVFERTVDGIRYRIKEYRPRVEGLFAKIQLWTNLHTKETHWRTISKDNVTTVYGRTSNSRIEDPHAPPDSPRVFSWLICESYDDRGNAIYYEYKEENSENVDRSLAHERNRTDRTRAANRYIKRIKYCNRTPVRYDPSLPREFREDVSERDDWLFEIVFDYGEGHYEEVQSATDTHRFVRASIDPTGAWRCRKDPFSSYRAGFEVRTYRLCRRVLLFHHFPEELGVDDYLVRSLEFDYEENSTGSFLTRVTQSGYRLQSDGTYLKKSLPSLEFTYSKALIRDEVRQIDPESLRNLPRGVDGRQYRWADIDGEGVSGILTEQADAWFYKRNLSPLHSSRFQALEKLSEVPSFTDLSEGGQELMDLAGDGQLDVVEFGGPAPGFYERTQEGKWLPFEPFESLPNVPWRDPNVRLVDLTGDGRPDILLTEEHAFLWFRSLGEKGFAPAERVPQALDEEKGPRLVFADPTQSIYLADMSGDGLVDIVRIRNGEVCYWPNLGYGRFGPKVTMDNSPYFDPPDHFDQRRIRLADVDGSGVTDIVYLRNDGAYIYLNESGNSWSDPVKIDSLPPIDNLSQVVATDLLGNGTACLVWSSPLPGNEGRRMSYIDLMGGEKPHLLTGIVNNMGAETRIRYAPSTKFYLADRAAGREWITKLPFPVHVVEQVETYDHISRNRFVTRYAYHHGYFDGEEREFRGFGLVERWDTEEFATLTADGTLPDATNIEGSSHVPPVLTRTWFHTGAYLKGERISRQYEEEYYREPELNDEQARDLLLPDTVLPEGLTPEEAREACRALKGSMLRQEIYALDGTSKESYPYTVVEQNFTVRILQPRGPNRHAVFLTHPLETITYHYERNPRDPRVQHRIVLQVDDFGNVLKEATIGYGRRLSDGSLPTDADREKQRKTLITYTERKFTNAIDGEDDHRTPLIAEERAYELTGYTPTGPAGRFRASDFVETGDGGSVPIFDGEIPYEEDPLPAQRQRRLIEMVRTLYRPDDLGASVNDPEALLPLGRLEPLALPGESYRLAFTPGLLARIFRRDGETLLPDPAEVLGGRGESQGGYVDLEGDGRWWIPSGRVFYSEDPDDTPVRELAEARSHFFLPRRYRNAFGQTTTVIYDDYDLLLLETRDPLGNRVTAGERNADGAITHSGNDYRVLQPWLVSDPNRNRSAVAFDALGMVVGTAVMGKPEENLGDSLEGFEPDLREEVVQEHLTNPLRDPHALLGKATTRLVYDLFAYYRTKESANPQPAVVWTLARETHESDLEEGERTRIQHTFSYSDGFGREIQRKAQAEPGPVPERDENGRIIVGADGQPVMTDRDVAPRWVGTGWTVFNNKGKPVRQYEPFFTETHRFEFDVRIGVSPVLFYDPVGRVVATLHPNHTWEKVVFDPWRQETWDVNDTVLIDPREDEDVGGFFARLPEESYLPTWHALRTDPAHAAAFAARYPDATDRENETQAARRTEIHAGTPTVAHFDTLGRTFLTVAHNRFRFSNAPADAPPEEAFYVTRVVFDIEGNRREVIDAKGRVVMRYDYHMGGPEEDEEGNRRDIHLIHQISMEAGERWVINDVAGNPIRVWDSRGFVRRMTYDTLRRPTGLYVAGDGTERLVERTEYGEGQGETTNHRTRVFRQFDEAGVVLNVAYDFKGNLLESSRRLAQDYRNGLDWSGDVPLEAETFTSRTRYDALNRPAEVTAPDGSLIRPTYNEANLLERLEANLRGADEATPFIIGIDYNARGQRERIAYGNGAVTTYDYDPLTFRLTRLRTTRNSGSEVLQDLRYTYDPAGNITHIRDDAQQTLYFRNSRIEPEADYTYDALYRLIEATGREHIGQNSGPVPSSWDDVPRVRLPHPGDGNAMGRYTERYEYDEVGNLLRMIHQTPNGSWKREYVYEEPSLIESERTSNRLSRTKVGSITETYAYDAHGNMIRMPHLPLMRWDFRDQLQATARQVRTDGGAPETTYYVYDASGQRVRKVTEGEAEPGQTPVRTKERIYLGGFEIYREYENDGTTVKLERETLHITDDDQRIALVETRTQGTDPAPGQLIRYQLGNHLGSVSLELDDKAQIISYEEYYPYGSTSYQAVRSRTETPKRYRYTGMERDEESGLNYHTARYYATWLGRWVSADPIGSSAGLNLYRYTSNRPIIMIDPAGTRGIVLGYTLKNGDLDTFLQSNSDQRRQMLQWSERIAEQQLDALKDFLRAVGRAQARELGLSGEEYNRFVEAEAPALTLQGRYLTLREDVARRGRGGREPSWVFQRLLELSQSGATVLVFTGRSLLRPGEAGITIPVQSSRTIAVFVSTRFFDRDRQQWHSMSSLELGYTLAHELTLHAWRRAYFPPEIQGNRLSLTDTNMRELAGDPTVSEHLNSIHRGTQLSNSDMHGILDLEGHLLDMYMREADPNAFSQIPWRDRRFDIEARRKLGGLLGTRVWTISRMRRALSMRRALRELSGLLRLVIDLIASLPVGLGGGE